jgi:SAM-dependent methyltransferase
LTAAGAPTDRPQPGPAVAAAPDLGIWNHYWQSDRIASCLDGAGARNYDDSVAAGWRAFFGTLPADCRILDLCTGNGAVAILAAETSLAEARAFDIVAVDQAEIDPPAYLTRHQAELSAIAFRPQTRVEALPFADRSFDAVVSQYGLEYSDLSRSLAELGRVIAGGGRVRLVLHAAEGVVSADAKRVIDEADFLLNEVDLPAAARRCFLAVTAAERTEDAGEDAHREARDSLASFEAALARTARRIPTAVDAAMLRNSGAVLLDTFKRHARLDVEQLVAKAEEVRTSILDHRGRLQALVDAAVTRDGAAAVADALIGLGAQAAQPSELHNGAALIGHVVEASFPP